MSPNTGEGILNSPIKVNCIDLNYDQYDHFSQCSKNEVTRKKEQIGGVYSSMSKIHMSIFYLFPHFIFTIYFTQSTVAKQQRPWNPWYWTSLGTSRASLHSLGAWTRIPIEEAPPITPSGAKNNKIGWKIYTSITGTATATAVRKENNQLSEGSGDGLWQQWRRQ